MSPKPIGTGRISVCMQCSNLTDNISYAVKVYKRQEQCDNQIDILERCATKKTKGIVKLIEVITDSKWTYIIMELIDGVNLLEHFNTVTLTGKIAYNTFTALWKIVNQLHSLNYAHGRICFKNIKFIRHLSELRLIGFGCAQPIKDNFDGHIDFWSIIVCLYTLLCGHSPFNVLQSNAPTKMVEMVRENGFNQQSENWITLRETTKTQIRKLFSNLFSTPNLKFILKETFQTPINNVEQLIDENENIVTIRATNRTAISPTRNIDEEEILKNTSIDGVLTTICNGVEKLKNGDDSMDSVESKFSVVPATQEHHFNEQQSRNGEGGDHDDVNENTRRRLRSIKLGKKDVQKTDPIGSPTSSSTQNFDVSAKEPINGHSRVGNTRQRLRSSKKIETAFVQQQIKVEKGDSSANTVSKKRTRESAFHGFDMSFEPNTKLVKKLETSESRASKDERLPKGTRVPSLIRRSPRLSPITVQNSKPPSNAKISGSQSNATNKKKSTKKSSSNITYTLYPSTKKQCIDQRVQNQTLGSKEHRRFVYEWPLRKPTPTYYVFERHDYKTANS